VVVRGAQIEILRCFLDVSVRIILWIASKRKPGIGNTDYWEYRLHTEYCLYSN
jgi:hypothetical protein